MSKRKSQRDSARQGAKSAGSKQSGGKRIIMEKRSNLSRNLFLATLILLITVVTLFLLLRILGSSKAVPRYIFIQEDSLERKYETLALIVRDEHIVKAGAEGEFISEFPQGTRVAKAELVGRVVGDNAKTRLSELNKAESDLIARRYELLNAEEGFEGRRIAEKKDLEIHSLMSRYYAIDKVKERGNLANISAALKLLLEQRSSDLRQVKFRDREYQQALENYENIKSLLANAAVSVSASESGLLSFSIDGHEELKIEDLQDKEGPELYELIRDCSGKAKLATGKVDAETPVFKIIHGINQYFITFLPAGLADEVETAQRISAESLDYGFELKRLRVLRAEETRQGTLLLLKADTGLAALSGQRLARLAIKLSSDRGLKLPRQALIDFKPGQVEAKVKIVSGGYVREIQVQILDFNSDYALIDNPEDESLNSGEVIGAATMVVVNPSAVKDGDPIDNIE
ncbi:MAG: HlyD family efflux transporter periplasmic adaptor subunit [Eubacteriales bacterium]|nr:HlyD family efflux transporter periplasmic adaptor subunit [Eubacteriales bacterium]